MEKIKIENPTESAQVSPETSSKIAYEKIAEEKKEGTMDITEKEAAAVEKKNWAQRKIDAVKEGIKKLSKEYRYGEETKAWAKNWVLKGKIKEPTEQEWEEFMMQAKADKFEGKPKIENGKLIYASQNEVNWRGGGGGGIVSPN